MASSDSHGATEAVTPVVPVSKPEDVKSSEAGATQPAVEQDKAASNSSVADKQPQEKRTVRLAPAPVPSSSPWKAPAIEPGTRVSLAPAVDAAVQSAQKQQAARRSNGGASSSGANNDKTASTSEASTAAASSSSSSSSGAQQAKPVKRTTGKEKWVPYTPVVTTTPPSHSANGASSSGSGSGAGNNRNKKGGRNGGKNGGNNSRQSGSGSNGSQRNSSSNGSANGSSSGDRSRDGRHSSPSARSGAENAAGTTSSQQPRERRERSDRGDGEQRGERSADRGDRAERGDLSNGSAKSTDGETKPREQREHKERRESSKDGKDPHSHSQQHVSASSSSASPPFASQHYHGGHSGHHNHHNGHSGHSSHRGSSPSMNGRGNSTGNGNNNNRNKPHMRHFYPIPASMPIMPGMNMPGMSMGVPPPAVAPGNMSFDMTMMMLLQQVQYYFSIENLCKDIFLRKQMNSNGFVPVSVLTGFSRMRTMSGGDANLVVQACHMSPELEVVGQKVRLRNNWHQWLLPLGDRLPAGREEDVDDTPKFQVESAVPFVPKAAAQK